MRWNTIREKSTGRVRLGDDYIVLFPSDMRCLGFDNNDLREDIPFELTVERDLSAHFVHRCNSGQETEFSDLIKDRCGDETWREYFGPKCDFKPFDKVLMRNKGVIPGKWFPSFFSHEEDGTYYDTSGVAFKECIPYEGNEALTMTDKEP